jgi:AcrR family transcriptional regulator
MSIAAATINLVGRQSRHTLAGMGRHKTISDEEVLRVARDVFRRRGHTASTREIAEAAGISEAVLYQRFGSKDELFFMAMHAVGPDIDYLLGPSEPSGDAQAYLQGVVVRLGQYFAEVIPLALHVMTHPSTKPAALARMQPRGPASIVDGLAARLAQLARRKRLNVTSEVLTARLLVSIAHDWALGISLGHVQTPRHVRDLEAMVDIVWMGLRALGR